MKRVSAEFPYDAYWLYIVYHSGENRRMANLILQSDITKRKTISYARYLMSIHLKRFLTAEEEVDHIDNDKMHDHIANLQILSKEQNREKAMKLLKESLPPTFIELVCPVCDSKFMYPMRNYRFHIKNGRTRFSCSRKCARTKI